jgi:hypothetical protein
MADQRFSFPRIVLFENVAHKSHPRTGVRGLLVGRQVKKTLASARPERSDLESTADGGVRLKYYRSRIRSGRNGYVTQHRLTRTMQLA